MNILYINLFLATFFTCYTASTLLVNPKSSVANIGRYYRYILIVSVSTGGLLYGAILSDTQVITINFVPDLLGLFALNKEMEMLTQESDNEV